MQWNVIQFFAVDHVIENRIEIREEPPSHFFYSLWPGPYSGSNDSRVTCLYYTTSSVSHGVIPKMLNLTNGSNAKAFLGIRNC